MPPEPRAETISYGPRRVPGPRGMGCQEDGAIVTDLIERFCDPDANQSAPWNTVVCTAGVPTIIRRMLSEPPACPSLCVPIFVGLEVDTASLVLVRSAG